LGLIPGVLTPVVSRRIGVARFLELSMTGRRISAKEACAWGLVNFSGSDITVDRYLRSCIEGNLEGDPDSIRAIKRTTRPYLVTPPKHLFELAVLTARKRVSPEAVDRLDRKLGAKTQRERKGR
jgi:enoyl-CoA hydratase/carnithine racemase